MTGPDHLHNSPLYFDSLPAFVIPSLNYKPVVPIVICNAVKGVMVGVIIELQCVLQIY